MTVDEARNSLPHPFSQIRQAGTTATGRKVYAPMYTDDERDQWIDRFRAAFFTNEDAGRWVLIFLARHWHFYDRELLGEEWRVQRQCFIDLLICLGVWQEDIADKVLLDLLSPPQKKPKSIADRIWLWFGSLKDHRTKRTPQEQGQRRR